MSEYPDSRSENDVADQWRELFEATVPGLRAFLAGRLAQSSDVDDCLQVVFIKMVESGGGVAPAARRAWLFRVAANESARMWRRKASTDRMLQKQGADTEEVDDDEPIQRAILNETTEQLTEAIQRLPDAWQQVLRLRIHENMTFQQISDALDIPLGTALTQMRRALERLKSEIEPNDS